MILLPLTNQESSANNGATHQAIVTADDLTTTTANTAQTIKLMDLASGDIVAGIWWRAKTFFKDASDTAFNTSTMSVGDNAAVDSHIAAAELNANGTTVKEGVTNTYIGPYTAGDKVAVTLNAMSGKNVNDLDVGELHVFIKLLRPSLLETASSASQIKTK